MDGMGEHITEEEKRIFERDVRAKWSSAKSARIIIRIDALLDMMRMKGVIARKRELAKIEAWVCGEILLEREGDVSLPK